jgi:hypothetical protein
VAVAGDGYPARKAIPIPFGAPNGAAHTGVNPEVASTENKPQRPSPLIRDEGTRVCRSLIDEAYPSGGVVGTAR